MIIYTGIIPIGFLILLFYIFHKVTEVNLNIGNISFNIKQAKEKLSIFAPKIPKILQRPKKAEKTVWGFSGYAFNLGKGMDGRYYFIGHFGNCQPPDYKFISVNCETIIGTDWDNTPQWDNAFNMAKELYKFSNDKEVPSYQGPGTRNNRQLFGVYACDKDISDN
jgi:hypothetical protein